MIYVSLTTIPERIKNIEKSINSIISQTLKPDKIFLNIPYKYERFNNVISDEEIPKFDKIVEITRCDDFGPGTKLMGSLKKLKPPIFFLYTNQFKEHVKFWKIKLCNKIIDRIFEAEYHCKINYKISKTICWTQ